MLSLGMKIDFSVIPDRESIDAEVERAEQWVDVAADFLDVSFVSQTFVQICRQDSFQRISDKYGSRPLRRSHLFQLMFGTVIAKVF